MQFLSWRAAASVAVIAALGLIGCKPVQTVWDEASQSSRHGHYVGVGIYNPGAPWAKLADAPDTADPASARTADDQAIIVVVDSDTGEVRACGDLSGYCIGMNPWKHALVATQVTPVALRDHPADSEGAADSPSASRRRQPR
jgi:hypothetical protein